MPEKPIEFDGWIKSHDLQSFETGFRCTLLVSNYKPEFPESIITKKFHVTLMLISDRENGGPGAGKH